jgi:2OG-Fe(II) oxygenase superfamily
VPPTENTLVVNFGRLLERWTDGRIKATPHRVIGSGRERYSVPFFYEPRIDAVIAPLRLRAADGVDAPASRPSSMAIMSGPRPRNSSNSPAWSLYGRRAARRTSRAIPRQRCETPTHVARLAFAVDDQRLMYVINFGCSRSKSLLPSFKRTTQSNRETNGGIQPARCFAVSNCLLRLRRRCIRRSSRTCRCPG